MKIMKSRLVPLNHLFNVLDLILLTQLSRDAAKDMVENPLDVKSFAGLCSLSQI